MGSLGLRNLNEDMDKLIKSLESLGLLREEPVKEAFLHNDRREFVPSELKEFAYDDTALPIAGGQTISQPYTVAFMIELLAPFAGQKILDIGLGSGWTTGILARITGDGGKVYAMEINSELYEFGKANLEKFGYKNIQLFNRSGARGLPAYAPFDRILVSATASHVPEALKLQLAPGGRLVLPIGPVFGSSIFVVEKLRDGSFLEKSFPGFAFVPLDMK